MPDEFKPCPFCGKPADQQVSRQSVKYAMCTDCGFSLRVSDWNTRPAEAALQAQVSALTEQRDAARKALWEVYVRPLDCPMTPETREQLDIVAYEHARKA